MTEAWRDPTAPVAARIGDLIARMTLEEKLAQLSGLWGIDPDVGEMAPMLRDALGDKTWDSAIVDGLGQLTRPFGSAPVEPLEGVRALAERQRAVMAANRFGIPAQVHEEILTGLAAWRATIYPSPLCWAASFDPALVEEMGSRIGGTMRTLGIHQGMAPVLDVVRDLRWGRVEESMGEDPFLVGLIGSAYVRGVQSTGAVATLKHFLGYSGSRAARNLAPVSAGPREVADVYLPPFEMALRAGARSVMNAYTDIDGVPSAADPSLFTTLLRDSLGFTGTVAADYFSVAFLETLHHVAASPGEAAGLALAAGIDVELPSVNTFGEPLLAAVRNGTVDEKLVDRALDRVLRQKCELGLLDPGWSPADPDDVDLDDPESRAIALELARRSVVLLANDGTLPLRAGARVAIVGPRADTHEAMLGCYSFPMHVLVHFPDVDPGLEILTIREAMADDFDVSYALGCPVLGGSVDDIEAAAETAAAADVCVVVLGDQSGLFGNGTSGEGCDVADLRLPGRQEELLEALLGDRHSRRRCPAGRSPLRREPPGRPARRARVRLLPGRGGGSGDQRCARRPGEPLGPPADQLSGCRLVPAVDLPGADVGAAQRGDRGGPDPAVPVRPRPRVCHGDLGIRVHPFGAHVGHRRDVSGGGGPGQRLQPSRRRGGAGLPARRRCERRASRATARRGGPRRPAGRGSAHGPVLAARRPDVVHGPRPGPRRRARRRRAARRGVERGHPGSLRVRARSGPAARSDRTGRSSPPWRSGPADARRLAARRAAPLSPGGRRPGRPRRLLGRDGRPGRGPDRGDVRAGGLRARRRRDLRRHVRWSWRCSGAGLAALPSAPLRSGRLPAVVQYQGYNGGRGLAHEHVFWATAGYAHLVVDTRGQGSGWTSGATGDPVGSAPSQPGFLTRGIEDPRTYYYARVYTDAVRALDALRAHDLVDPSRVAVAGTSQGGGIALAAAALASDARGRAAVRRPVPVRFPTGGRRSLDGALSRAGALLGRSPGSRRHRVPHLWRTSTGPSWGDRRQLLPLFSVALMDATCPPSTVFAAYHAYAGPKQIQIYQFNDHEGGEAFHRGLQLDWLAATLAT